MVGIIDEACIRFPVGSRIKVGENRGTVKYVGEVVGHPGSWLGIEWDDPRRGKHDGSVDGKRYFQTQHPNAASFMPATKPVASQSLEAALRERYHDYSTASLDQSLIQAAQESLQAPLFEVVGMEKLARKQSKFEELTDISVDEWNVETAGYLQDFTALQTLNLSRTLIWNWEAIADIVRQLPSLTNLNLSCNRIVLPSDVQVQELEPAFRHLEQLNLGNCGLADWADVVQTARLWPNIQSLGLQDNPISKLSEVNTNDIFRQLKELDLHRTKLMDFDQVCKLGNIRTLVSLNLMENGIDEVRLPDCEPSQKLNIFVALEKLNLLHNPIWNEMTAFNELDKLPKLRSLSMTPHLKSNFDEMFAKAVGMISNLKVVNKAQITPEERRFAIYDVWKKYAAEWVQASQRPETLREFYKKHRTYATIVKNCGSPADFVPRENSVNSSNLIKIRIRNEVSNEVWERKVPRRISVQTLQGLIVKHFNLEKGNTMPQLLYVNEEHPDTLVPLDKVSKTLDYFSVQDNDVVIVRW